jgi:glycosyltransferase involved in cell wall biosynthesis
VKILFVWTGVTSYMADCWRELAKRPEVELKVVIEAHHSGSEIDVNGVLQGFDVSVVDKGADVDFGDWLPNVIFAVGWRSRVVRKIVERSKFCGIPKICCFDMPWRWQLRCVAARWALGGFLRHYDAAFVPGNRAAKYARWLGFKSIYRGLFSLNTDRFNGKPGNRDFMFIGRDAPEKRIDVIKKAYDIYRRKGGKWNLDIYGGKRFVQPAEVPKLYQSHACLLLASSFDPWPLVMLEATAAGLSVIASDRCGNVEELGARKVRYGNVGKMADAMLEIEHGIGVVENRERAKRYDCHCWVERVLEICDAYSK